MSDSALSIIVILFLLLIWNIRALALASLESQERIEQIRADAAIRCAQINSPYLDEPEDEPAASTESAT